MVYRGLFLKGRFPLESALAFSFKETFKEGEENGILQAWEIFDSMRIDADLVVLSGCQTGLGEVQGAEGLTGLTRAFQFAGARSIIASFWSVEDQSTAALMTRFYRYLKAGKPKSEALRQAQLDLIRQPLEVKEPFFGWFERTVKRDRSHPFSGERSNSSGHGTEVARSPPLLNIRGWSALIPRVGTKLGEQLGIHLELAHLLLV